MADPALLAEAYKRGLLPADMRSVYEEGVRRGIVKDDYARGRLGGKDPAFGATANFDEHVWGMDEAKAGISTVAKTLSGDGTLAENWRSTRDFQKGAQDQFKADHPIGAKIAQTAGDYVMAAPALMTGGATVAPTAVRSAAPVARTAAQRTGQLLMTGGRNAVVGAAYGAASGAAGRGTLEERVGDANVGAVTGAVVGAVAPVVGAAFGAGARRLATKNPPSMTRANDAAILKDLGVETSIPQRMGGMAKQAEDLAMRAPILGPAISGARARQVEQLNRGWALKALQPVGKTLPAEIKPGFEMVEHVDDELGKVYQQATDMVPRVVLDEPLLADAARIGAKKADLSEAEARQWDTMLADKLARLKSGEASGETVKQIHGELGALQAEQARKGNTTLSNMIADLRRSIMGTVERANPEAAKLIGKADEGWRIYSQMNDAAAQATNRGGVFLPGQINTQVRADARAQGSNMAGKGKGAMQPEATAAARMIPDQFGNPGTANAVGLGGLGVGLMTAPVKTVAVAGGLTAASTPYWLMARKVIESLPANAGAAEIRAADAELAKLMAKDPAVAALRQQFAERVGVGLAIPMSQENRR